MVQAISASFIANMRPGVVGVGGSNLSLSGMLLTNSPRVPIGTYMSFSTLAAVGAFFGLQSTEYALATIYFTGPDGATITPAALLFAQYASSPVAGYVRGGPGITLAAVQAITSGTLTVTADGGSALTSSALNLSGATSLSNAAALIQAAFTSPGFTVAYDSLSGAFTVTSNTTGATSAVVVSTGTNATALKLTTATGAVTSPGSAPNTPVAFMTALAILTKNWFSFSTTWQPSTSDGLAFAQWADSQNFRYWFLGWDTNAANLGQSPTTTLKAQIVTAGYAGTTVVYAPINGASAAVFAMSWAACINFSQANGRSTLAGKKQTGMLPDVTDDTTYLALTANGLDFLGLFGTSANTFGMWQPGSVSGKFLWADSFANEVWLLDQLQVALMTYLNTVGSIPFNDDGYAATANVMVPYVEAAKTFGAVRSGVTLSPSQVTQINNATGNLDAVNSIVNDGYYLSVADPGPTVRTARGSPLVNLYYADGQSVQKITVNSFEVQ